MEDKQLAIGRVASALQLKASQRSTADNQFLRSFFCQEEFFVGVDPDVVQQLTQCFGYQHAARGETILHAGELTDRMYLLLSGSCSAVRHSRAEDFQPLHLQYYSGETWAAAALVTSSRRSNLHVVAGPAGAHLAVLPRSSWSQLCARAPLVPAAAAARVALLCCAARALARGSPCERTLEQTDDLAAVLAHLPDMQKHSPLVLREMAQSAMTRRAPGATVLFEEGGPVGAQFTVLAGQLQIRQRPKAAAALGAYVFGGGQSAATAASLTAAPAAAAAAAAAAAPRTAAAAAQRAGPGREPDPDPGGQPAGGADGGAVPLASENSQLGSSRSVLRDKIKLERAERQGLRQVLALQRDVLLDDGSRAGPGGHHHGAPPGGHGGDSSEARSSWMKEFVSRAIQPKKADQPAHLVIGQCVDTLDSYEYSGAWPAATPQQAAQARQAARRRAAARSGAEDEDDAAMRRLYEERKAEAEGFTEMAGLIGGSAAQGAFSRGLRATGFHYADDDDEEDVGPERVASVALAAQPAASLPAAVELDRLKPRVAVACVDQGFAVRRRLLVLQEGGWYQPVGGRPLLEQDDEDGASGLERRATYAGRRTTEAAPSLEECEEPGSDELQALFGAVVATAAAGHTAGEVPEALLSLLAQMQQQQQQSQRGGGRAKGRPRRSASAITGPGGCDLLVFDLDSMRRGQDAARDVLVTQRLAVLQALEPLRGLNQEHLEQLALMCQPLEVGASYVIARQGQQVDALHLVMEGEVRVYDDPDDVTQSVSCTPGRPGTSMEAAAGAAAAQAQAAAQGSAAAALQQQQQQTPRGAGTNGSEQMGFVPVKLRKAVSALTPLMTLSPGGALGESVLGYPKDVEALQAKIARQGEPDDRHGTRHGYIEPDAVPPSRYIATAITMTHVKLLLLPRDQLKRFHYLRSALPPYAELRRGVLLDRRTQAQASQQALQLPGARPPLQLHQMVAGQQAEAAAASAAATAPFVAVTAPPLPPAPARPQSPSRLVPLLPQPQQPPPTPPQEYRPPSPSRIAAIAGLPSPPLSAPPPAASPTPASALLPGRQLTSSGLAYAHAPRMQAPSAPKLEQFDVPGYKTIGSPKAQGSLLSVALPSAALAAVLKANNGLTPAAAAAAAAAIGASSSGGGAGAGASGGASFVASKTGMAEPGNRLRARLGAAGAPPPMRVSTGGILSPTQGMPRTAAAAHGDGGGGCISPGSPGARGAFGGVASEGEALSPPARTPDFPGGFAGIYNNLGVGDGGLAMRYSCPGTSTSFTPMSVRAFGGSCTTVGHANFRSPRDGGGPAPASPAGGGGGGGDGRLPLLPSSTSFGADGGGGGGTGAHTSRFAGIGSFGRAHSSLHQQSLGKLLNESFGDLLVVTPMEGECPSPKQPLSRRPSLTAIGPPHSPIATSAGMGGGGGGSGVCSPVAASGHPGAAGRVGMPPPRLSLPASSALPSILSPATRGGLASPSRGMRAAPPPTPMESVQALQSPATRAVLLAQQHQQPTSSVPGISSSEVLAARSSKTTGGPSSLQAGLARAFRPVDKAAGRATQLERSSWDGVANRGGGQQQGGGGGGVGRPAGPSAALSAALSQLTGLAVPAGSIR